MAKPRVAHLSTPRCGAWTPIDLLARGGNGEVWRASHPEHGPGALKVLQTFQIATKQQKRKARFLAEIDRLRALPGLDITGVMPIIDSGIGDDDRPWFAMPIAETLEPPPDGRYPWAIHVVLSVAETVAALHAAGVVHRDIKPSNILQLDGVVVLSDFGLSRAEDDVGLTGTGEQVGSFGFVAPECIGRSDEPQFGCDVYSLAKTAWVLLTGEVHPPAGRLGSEVTDSLAVRGLEGHVLNVEPMLQAATSRDPLDRPTMRQFADALRRGIAASSPDEADAGDNNRPTGPSTRAATLFRDEAATNRRRTEVEQVGHELARGAGQSFLKEWGDIADSLGWRPFSSNGGRSGPTQRLHHGGGWEPRGRYFGTGPIGARTFDLSCTTRQRRFDGSRALTIGVAVSIEWTDDNGRPQDRLVADRVFDGFAGDPNSILSIQSEIGRFVASDEVKFRTVEQLREISGCA
ncbi:MAG: serine/threonine-protein kinase [Acidimicrobiia bacterium]